MLWPSKGSHSYSVQGKTAACGPLYKSNSFKLMSLLGCDGRYKCCKTDTNGILYFFFFLDLYCTDLTNFCRIKVK